jgi:Protein of unknown function (DUF3891)
MILRPIDPPVPAKPGEFAPAWKVVEPLQRRSYESCWMITQPSHGALAGEIAARLKHVGIPKLEAEVVRAIALHDAGWGMPDAQAVMRSRAVQQSPPKSFLQVTVPEFLAAWTQSIEVAQSTSPAGGYIVSRHFQRLAEHRLALSEDPQQDRSLLHDFVNFESARRAKLAAKQGRTEEELEVLADVLQFCDLLSLYLCSGARDNVEFPEYFGVKARLTAGQGGFRMDPPLVEGGTQFAVATLRHPAIKGDSGREMNFAIL